MLLIKSNFSKTNFKPHIHDNFSIGIITEGKCPLNIKKEKKLIKKDEIRIINPLETHYVENISNWSYINLFLEKEYVYNIASSITSLSSEIIFSNKIEDIKIKNLFKKIISINNLNHIESEEILIELIENLIKKHSIIDVREHKLDFNKKELLDYIYANYLEDIKLEDLEKIAGVSKYHIIRTFKKHFLLTPYQFILKLRINHALKLIKKDYPLSLIAIECGFFDQSHFIKEFKKIYGLTPFNFIQNTNLSQNTEQTL